ncbi:MAG: hypothetical protein J5824_09920 [Lachnospiraceae bacterium]|nr:hypothetical protein [Lachnospiraceae bacterium]
MSLLKSYTCSKCAGVLMFDADQEFFDCPFCGNRFDQVDFHIDEIITQAEESLKEEAFSSAKEKFNSILDKDPSNFEALKGLILCEIKASSLESLESPEVFDPVAIASLKNLIARVKRQASPEDSGFFNQLITLIDLSEKLKMYQNSIDALYSDSTRANVNKSFSEKRSRKAEENRFNYLGIPVTIIVCLGFLALYLSQEYGGYVFAFSLIGIIVGCVVWAIFNDYHPSKPVYENNPINDAWEMKQYLEGQYSHFEKIYGDEYAKLLELDRASKASKPEEPVPEEISSETINVEPDHPDAVICSKCAGQLYLDKARRVYECRSCGVAYGISLFFGMPMEKALRSMNTGRYGDAQKRFENILMVDPSSFDAHLGRILCAGKWSRISDIDTFDVISTEDSGILSGLLSDAKQHVAESDRDFFEKLDELISKLGKICLNNSKLDELNRQVEVLESISHVYYLAEQIATDANGVSIKRSKTLSDIENIDKETRQLSHEFLALKRTLIQQKNDCVLAK